MLRANNVLVSRPFRVLIAFDDSWRVSRQETAFSVTIIVDRQVRRNRHHVGQKHRLRQHLQLLNDVVPQDFVEIANALLADRLAAAAVRSDDAPRCVARSICEIPPK